MTSATSGGGGAESSPGYTWVFKDAGAETTLLMNLVNLPMLKSAALKKLKGQGPSAANGSKSDKESLKKQIKLEFTRALQDPAADASPAEQEDADPDDISHLSTKTGGSNKTLLKQLAFKGYDERERLNYSETVLSFAEDESRPVTALDEVLRALLFVCQLIEKNNRAETIQAEARRRFFDPRDRALPVGRFPLSDLKVRV